VEPRRTYKSFQYRATTTWNSARRGILSALGRPNIVVGSPPDFKGEKDNWAPEELLVGSLNTCMMLTFLSLAQTKGMAPVGYESEAEGLLANVEGKYRITEIMVRPRVIVTSQKELEAARTAMESVEAHCFMAIPLTLRSRSDRNLSLLPGQSDCTSVPHAPREYAMVGRQVFTSVLPIRGCRRLSTLLGHSASHSERLFRPIAAI
jgi:organic hydroperoxide reductase OsmC/OhrA